MPGVAVGGSKGEPFAIETGGNGGRLLRPDLSDRLAEAPVVVRPAPSVAHADDRDLRAALPQLDKRTEGAQFDVVGMALDGNHTLDAG
jgi:hypothetical protein